MHLLAATPGGVSDGSEAVDLGQSPGELIFLTAADTELGALSQARRRIDDPDFPSLRLANLLNLGHNMSVDMYAERVISTAKLVIVRLLGGRGYWPYGVEQIAGVCRENGVRLALLPGDDQPDAELSGFCTLAPDVCHRLWQYMVHGGPDNAVGFLNYAATLIGYKGDWLEPLPLLRAGRYERGTWVDGRPVAALVFYRALLQAANLQAVDALIAALAGAGLNPLPVYVAGLKDPVVAAIVERIFQENPPDVVLNTTGFAVSTPGRVLAESRPPTSLDGPGAPVLQAVFSGSNRADWADGAHGLSARDIAMNVALPEVDGRIFSRAVSFKGRSRRDDLSETDIVTYEPVADRVAFTAALAANWARLAGTGPEDRRVAFILANYPNRDGRIGNGVGLDTAAGALVALQAMAGAGYRIDGLPDDGDALIARLAAGPTNDTDQLKNRLATETLSLAAYREFFETLPETMRRRIIERWGSPEADPFMRHDGCFAIPAYRLGNVAICLQPARGYNIDPAGSYHDPDLVPPHGYFAVYAWIRTEFAAHAVVHFGKHGNLEWLPGKSLALSRDCFPEATLGAMPNLYPFIVNDPGEGTQAKRRAGAVIIDHLTPPLTRAESYGPLAQLEQLVDEYYEAAGVDPRRLKVLKREILTLCSATGLGADCGMDDAPDDDAALGRLDNYLCELKELQIRDGLHVFGESPAGRLQNDLLVALVRTPRGTGQGGDASLIRALADDLELEFDPLDCVMADPWTGPRPEIMAADDRWRSHGDTVERLEMLASRLVAGATTLPPHWAATGAVMDMLNGQLRPAVAACGAAETAGLLRGLDGRFVEPGPSGAPTRGRPDVLPTGRNFYSIDSRTAPTPAAWTLGWKSAGLLVENYRQQHGAWPRTMALTAWGTSNMRTGGDDIAQGLALMGVKPTWDTASRRVSGFEVMPLAVLDRPRVDVTLRVSGFFRDAFPGLIDIFSSAARAVAALDEGPADNPLAARVGDDIRRLTSGGMDADTAASHAGYRVFGSMPGAYGAGLQALIDEKGWQGEDDLARAYVAWGGYAYGQGAAGEAAHGLFESRLKSIDAVVQNQDNREHDLLDSDDYYQFEGGITAAVRSLSGRQPAVYHNDHSRPETPRVRTLEDEIARIVRARVVNPKWIDGVRRHGYKGAFEMAATVDYLFAFAATAHCVADHHFDAVYEAYLGDPDVQDFLRRHNPAALAEMVDRLLEAQQRGLWKPRLNSTHAALEDLRAAENRERTTP